jgi:hypothetical protein
MLNENDEGGTEHSHCLVKRLVENKLLDSELFDSVTQRSERHA